MAVAHMPRSRDPRQQLLTQAQAILESLRDDDLDWLTDDELVDRDQLLAQIANLVDALRLPGIELIDTREAWRGHGSRVRSTLDLLVERHRTAFPQAKTLVDLARKLRKLPATRSAVRRGDLTAAEAKPVSKLADLPDTVPGKVIADAEQETLELAKTASPRQVREAVDTFAHDVAPSASADAEATRKAMRRLRTWRRDGMVGGDFLLPAADGDALLSRLDAEARALRIKNDDRTVEQLHADALVSLSNASGGDRRRAPRAHLVVHCDADTLTSGTPKAALRGSGEAMSARELRRLSCDATVRRIVMSGRDTVVSVASRTAIVDSPLWDALWARDRGCVICGSTRDCVAHHVIHWTHGGPTSLDNLVLLCGHHHDQLHDLDLQAVNIMGRWELAPCNPPPTPASGRAPP